MAGIYIHIPFCRQACSYCNFHFSTTLTLKKKLLNAIKEEIILTRVTDPLPIFIETIYFGGGTPSLLSIDEINELLQTIHEHFEVSKQAEITLEANPDDISIEILDGWKKIGVNRLSLGIQSFNNAELKWMNRAHNTDQSLQSIQNIIHAGYTNFSADLIYGSPLLSNEDFIKNIEIILGKNIPHVSCYALTVEPKTALHAMIIKKKTFAIDDNKQAEQFDILLAMMEANGYEQYEISNFAKPGFRSRHNSSYWKGTPYYGFGPAAHSYNGKNIRHWNIANNALYIQSIEKSILPYEEEILTPSQQFNETIMISLRTMEGLDTEKVKKVYGEQRATALLNAAQQFILNNKMIIENNKMLLTKEGKFFADGIAAELFC